MITQIAADGAIGFDTATPLTAAGCQSLAALGNSFAVRYVSHAAAEARDLTAAEVEMIIASGLALMIVAHPPSPGWTPNGSLGLSHAKAALANMPANILPGVTVWCDLEGLAQAPSGIVCAYVNSWSSVIKGAGFDPGIYVGYDTWLTGTQLYENLTLDRYWKSASAVPSPSPRGWCMQQQLMASPVAGIGIDRDVIAADALGGLPTWLIAS